MQRKTCDSGSFTCESGERLLYPLERSGLDGDGNARLGCRLLPRSPGALADTARLRKRSGQGELGIIGPVCGGSLVRCPGGVARRYADDGGRGTKAGRDRPFLPLGDEGLDGIAGAGGLDAVDRLCRSDALGKRILRVPGTVRPVWLELGPAGHGQHALAATLAFGDPLDPSGVRPDGVGVRLALCVADLAGTHRPAQGRTIWDDAVIHVFDDILWLFCVVLCQLAFC